jgi:hypothetical protein
MTEEATVVETEETGSKEVARDYETEARAQGWVPEAEFKGEKKPAQFLDAETFVKRGEELTPFIRKENSKLKRELDETKSDFAKRVERLEKANKAAFDAATRSHEAEIARIKREQRAAVASGDEAEFDRLEAVKDGLAKAAPKMEEPEKVNPEQEFEAKKAAWIGENQWFNTDFDLRKFTMEYSEFYGTANPSKSFEEVMKVTKAEVEKRFPEKFGGKKTNGHAAVDGGSDFSGVFKGKGKTETDLPAEARAAGERFVKQGLYKDLKAYAKEYFND